MIKGMSEGWDAEREDVLFVWLPCGQGAGVLLTSVHWCSLSLTSHWFIHYFLHIFLYSFSGCLFPKKLLYGGI